jgi:CheY-like chemotaxis protein
MKKTALIVDDSRVARMMIRGYIQQRRADWEVLEAADAREALERIEAYPVDCACVDLNMPGQDGLSLMDLVRDRKPQIPLALLTANTQQSVVDKAVSRNVRCLHKPITEATLIAMLAVLDG